MTTCVPPSDNKFAALHGAVWSGGSFVYVPEDVTVEMPVQAYFRMNSEWGQFEHTLIIAEEGSEVHYIEGCSAPKYGTHNLHSGGVEVFVGEDAHVQYSTVQNWSVEEHVQPEYQARHRRGKRHDGVGLGSMGSKVTMLYPCTILKGRGSTDTHITIALAGEGQDIDTGAKVYHNAPERRVRPSNPSRSPRTAAAPTTAASSTSPTVPRTRAPPSSVTP